MSNFGLIGRDADGWVLACEEHIGGLLLDVKASGDWLVALTESGVWLSHDGVCSWARGPTSERSTWFLDSAVGVASQDAPELLVLAPDAVEQNTKLERSVGEVFEVVHAFDASVAFRIMAASADLEQIYVSGYSQGPRTWHLSYSLDAGQNFTDIAPTEVDNMGAVMVPKRVDPNNGARLFLIAQTQAGTGDELWSFDASSNELRRLTTLLDSEVLSNIAFQGDEMWIAGRRNGAGSLYRAPLDTLEFTRVVSDAPSLACLETVGETLLTCANDYSYESRFIVAEVQNQGTAFLPRMQVADLATLRACDDSCAATQDWLTTTYGPTPPGSSGEGAEPEPTEASPEPEPRPKTKSGCNLQRSSQAHRDIWHWMLVAAVAAARSLFKKRATGSVP